MSVDSTSESLKLSDIKVSGYNTDDGAWGEFKLTVLDNFGLAATDDDGNYMRFFWYDNSDIPAGWYDADGEVAWDSENVIFNAGQAFWVQGEGLTVMGSGAVNFNPVTVATESAGNTALANPYPVEITLADISVSGYNVDDGAWGEFKLTVLDGFGLAAKDENDNYQRYYWYDNSDIQAGWYDADGEVQWSESTSFPAGQGFWIQGEGLVVEFTNPAAPPPAE